MPMSKLERSVLAACTAAGRYAYRPWNLELVAAEPFTTKSGGRRGLHALVPLRHPALTETAEPADVVSPAELHYGR